MKLELWILLRLCIAAIAGGMLGYERATTGKRAGLRTHMLVAMGSTLFMSSGDLALDWWARQVVPAGGSPSILQVQIAFLTPVQAIATGIGFLGAGTIFVGRHQHQAHGLTTAASIWVTAAIGVAVGCDRFLLALGASLLAVVILRILIRFEPRPELPTPGLVLTSSGAEGSAGPT